MKQKSTIKYLRIQQVNGRLVSFAQLFSEDGEKLFPSKGPVDAPLVQVLDYVYEEDLDVENSLDVLMNLVRDHGFSS